MYFGYIVGRSRAWALESDYLSLNSGSMYDLRATSSWRISLTLSFFILK